MRDTIQEVLDFMRTRRRERYPAGGGIAPPMACRDGFTMSVQAGEGNYSTPRSETGPWTAYEVGFPSEEEEILMPYAEDPSTPTRTVYGWVPIATVALVVDKHGGLAP